MIIDFNNLGKLKKFIVSIVSRYLKHICILQINVSNIPEMKFKCSEIQVLQ